MRCLRPAWPWTEVEAEVPGESRVVVAAASVAWPPATGVQMAENESVFVGVSIWLSDSVWASDCSFLLRSVLDGGGS